MRLIEGDLVHLVHLVQRILRLSAPEYPDSTTCALPALSVVFARPWGTTLPPLARSRCRRGDGGRSPCTNPCSARRVPCRPQTHRHRSSGSARRETASPDSRPSGVVPLPLGNCPGPRTLAVAELRAGQPAPS